VVEQSFSDAFQSAAIENALEAAGLNPASAVKPTLLRGLDHPQESVRRAALAGLMNAHLAGEDFERIAVHVQAEVEGVRLLAGRALFRADAARAEELVLGWMAEGVERDLWLDLAQLVAPSRRSATALRAAALLAGLSGPTKTWIAAPAARAGDRAALDFLRLEAASADEQRRIVAIQALRAAGAASELLALWPGEPADSLRVLLLEGLAEAGALDDARRSVLTAALDDADPAVRAHALALLVHAGDAAATDRALAQLHSDQAALLQDALLALREPLQSDGALRERAWTALLERQASEEHRPIQQRTATIKAMGILPLAEAADSLLALAREHPDERIEGLRAHEWILIQAANTGVQGRAVLARALAAETDLERRLDLIFAVGTARDDLAREALLQVCEDPQLSPYERLAAADRLVRIGPASQIAPRLKRVAYALEAKDARAALHCLLWEWY
jgi:hypothetical protein